MTPRARFSVRRALVALGLAMAGACGATAARADDPPAMVATPTDEDLLAEGVALRKEGRDAEALADFQRAYALRATPRAAAQMGLAYQALAQWRDAERELALALEDTASSWISGYRSELEASLATAREHLAWLEVETNVSGAEVALGEEAFGSLPLDRRVRVLAGDARVRLRAPGREPIERVLQISPQSQVRAEFLFAVAQVPAPAIAAPAPSTVAQPERPVATPHRTLAWVTLGVAGVLGLSASAAMAAREIEANIYNGGACAPSDGLTRYDRCGRNRDIGSAAETIGIAAFVGAGVVAAVSATLFWSPWRSGSSQAARIGCVPALIGLSCQGTF